MKKPVLVWGIAAAIVIATIATGVAVWMARKPARPAFVSLEARPQRIMGTSCLLVAMASDAEVAKAALGDAESALRHVEALTSTWMESTPVSRLNQAKAGQEMAVPPEVITVLRAARRIHGQSGGSFDVTVGPLVALWHSAATELRFPEPKEIDTARALSGWEDFHLSDTSVVKAQDSAQVDLGGIAKGFAIDQAVAAMRAAGADAGRVQLGEDLRVFGKHPKKIVWELPVRSPFERDGTLLTLRLNEGAVCTTGDFRFGDGAEPRHEVIDPRTGQPAVMAHSATAVAADAMTADAWATTLYIQGPIGIGLLPEGVDGVAVAGKENDRRIWATPAAGNATIEASVRDSLQVIGRKKPR